MRVSVRTALVRYYPVLLPLLMVFLGIAIEKEGGRELPKLVAFAMLSFWTWAATTVAAGFVVTTDGVKKRTKEHPSLADDVMLLVVGTLFAGIWYGLAMWDSEWALLPYSASILAVACPIFYAHDEKSTP